jgi:hypothetical protein
MSNIPKWIEEADVASARQDAENAARVKESANATKLLSEQAPDVWQRFLNALKANTEALVHLKSANVNGVTELHGKSEGQTNCQVIVRSQSSTSPAAAILVFHYSDSMKALRVNNGAMENKPETVWPMRLAPDDKVGIYVDSKIFTPEHLAEEVIKRMVSDVNSSSGSAYIR